MGLKSVPKYVKLRPRKQYKAETVAKRLPMQQIGFAGAAGDLKYVDTATATYANDTTGSITHISVIPTGTLVTTKTGKSCRATSLQVRGQMQGGSGGSINAKLANYLVWDNQPDKALAAITDVLVSANANSMVNRDNASRFRIIRKWVKPLTGNFSSGYYTTDSNHSIDDFIKLPKDCIITTTAAGTTGVIGEVISGALLFVTVGTQAAGANAGNSTLNFRLNFTE